MSLRTPSVTLVLTLAAGVFAAGATAEAQQAGNEGNLYQVQRGERFDDWTLQGFRSLDADGNGRITAAEWSYDREDFRRADHNRDGIVTQREFLGEAANDADARRRRLRAAGERRALPRSGRQPRRSRVAQRMAQRSRHLRSAGREPRRLLSPVPRWPLPTRRPSTSRASIPTAMA